MIRMAKEKTLLYVLLAIGITIAVLSATGNLNNANSLSTIIILAIAGVSVALLYEFGEDVPGYRSMPYNPSYVTPYVYANNRVTVP